MSLVEFRAERGWSQNTLARKIGCTASSVGRWELGLKQPSNKYQDALRAIGFEWANGETHE